MKKMLSCFILFTLTIACRPGEVVDVTWVVVETAVVTPTILPSHTPSPPPPTELSATSTPAPTPPATKELIICQAAEPDSLYIYNSHMLDGQNILHGIYENLTTERSYDYQAQGIVKLPNLADGDAEVTSMTVQTGDRVVDAFGDMVELVDGVTVVDTAGSRVTFDGTPVDLPQMVAHFTLRPMVWSDGVPVSAADSVFSFELNRDTEPPFGEVVNKALVAKTAVYEATGALSLRWVGLPGYLDQTYFLNVWPPLPQHQLGDMNPDELLDAPETARFPLATGPFVVEEWIPGQHIRLGKNNHYYRADEGLPAVDTVLFRFIPDPDQVLTNLLSGQCHIATRSVMDMGKIPLLLAAQQNGELAAHLQTGTVFEHLDFGINSYGDYGDGNGRPDWFEDVRVRQAVAMCIDRQRIIDELLFGIGDVLNSYVPDEHPLYPPETAVWPYDQSAANALLDDAGLTDTDGDGIREAVTGHPFVITYLSSSGAEMRPAVAAIIAENLDGCGIQLEQQFLPAGDLFANGPEGPLFGRRFDLAEFAWLTTAIPPCTNWLSRNITGPEEEGYGGWDNLNNTGWTHAEFDSACLTAMSALPGTPNYIVAHQEAMRIFGGELPIVPLFQRVFAAAARPEVVHFGLDPTQVSELWNLYEIDLENEVED